MQPDLVAKSDFDLKDCLLGFELAVLLVPLVAVSGKFHKAMRVRHRPACRYFPFPLFRSENQVKLNSAIWELLQIWQVW